MTIEFPIGTKVISMGRVADPVIPIPLKTRQGYLPFDFLIDTGADCSMIPASIAETEFGVRLSRCPHDVFFGIEGTGVRVYRGSLLLKIGPHPLRVRCVFSTHEHCPLILGRMDLFSHFSITFDNDRRVIRFTRIARAAGSRARIERAAARILKARLRLPAGHTAESVGRHLRRA